MRGDILTAGGSPTCSLSPFCPANIKPPRTCRAGVPATGSAGMVTFNGLMALRSKPTTS